MSFVLLLLSYCFILFAEYFTSLSPKTKQKMYTFYHFITYRQTVTKCHTLAVSIEDCDDYNVKRLLYGITYLYIWRYDDSNFTNFKRNGYLPSMTFCIVVKTVFNISIIVFLMYTTKPNQLINTLCWY